MPESKNKTNPTVMTGDDVGRLLIADLVTLYKNALRGTKNSLLSGSETTRLVNSLEKTDDIRAYNEYKYLHDFVVTVPMRFLLAQSLAEVAFERLCHALETTCAAEEVNRARQREPVIVTQTEYLKMKGERGQSVFAILQESPLTLEMVDKNGRYRSPRPSSFFENHRAETLLSCPAGIPKWIRDLKRHYREMYAFHEFLSLVEEFAQVKDLKVILSPVDETLIERINDAFRLWENIGLAHDRDEPGRQRLLEGLKKMLAPIDSSSLRPTQNAIKATKANLSFSIFHGFAAEFINQYLVQPEDAE